MTNPIPEPNVLKALQMFLSFCTARNYSPKTLRAYNADLLTFVCSVGHDTPVSAITRKAIRQYLMSLSPDLERSSVVRKLACVRSFFAWLLIEGYICTNPSEDMSGPRRYQTLPDVPSETDMKRLLDGRMPGPCPSRDRAVLELLYSCGLRASEAAGVNLDDFRTDGTLLIRGKGRKERIVPLGRMARRAVRRWQRERKTLLRTRPKTKALFFSVGPLVSLERLDVRSIHRIVKRTAEAKGLPPYHPHQLRHACATHMHDRGAPIQAISALLGHEKVSTTANIYTRVSSGRMLAVYNAAHPHATETKRGKP